VVTDLDPRTGEYLPVRIRRVQELVATIDHAYCPDQYANPLNPRAHRKTVQEIVQALPRLDYLFCATSSCGTLRGCAEYIRGRRLPVKIVAVDALGSAIFGPPVGGRLLPGHGASVRPKLYHDGLADAVVRVGDLGAVVGCRRLAAREAIIVGGSSGAVVSAMESMRDRIPSGARCALVFADRGERYLNTIYDDDWVAAHFGDVSHEWAKPQMEAA
jgi:N-(2-amino-2-carboxyethyl)-L-glutamate synthase